MNVFWLLRLINLIFKWRHHYFPYPPLNRRCPQKEICLHRWCIKCNQLLLFSRRRKTKKKKHKRKWLKPALFWPEAESLRVDCVFLIFQDCWRSSAKWFSSSTLMPSNWWMIFRQMRCSFCFDFLADGFFPPWSFASDSKLALEERTVGSIDLISRFTYSWEGFFFLSVSLRVGGGIRQVRALMILKWRGPELSDCVGTGRRWCRSLPPSSCFPLSLFSSVFIYRFIALHSYMHTRPHTWNAYRQQPFHFAGRNLPGRAISPFPALFLSCAVVIYLIVCYKAQDVGRRRRGRS